MIEVDIYIDVLVVLNTYMTWILLSLTAALTHTYSKPIRRALAAFSGGASSLIILLPISGKLMTFTVLCLKAASCFLITGVAFFGVGLKKYLMLTASFIGSNMLLFSALSLVENLLGAPKIALTGGFVYLDISPLALILSTAAIYFLLCRFSAMRSFCLGRLNSYRVEFRIGCKAFSLDGVADTGNKARDLFSGLPVIICTGINIDGGRGFRAVPYQTISGEGVLYAVNPGSVTFRDEKGRTKSVSALVASAPGSEKRAVFDPDILR